MPGAKERDCLMERLIGGEFLIPLKLAILTVPGALMVLGLKM